MASHSASLLILSTILCGAILSSLLQVSNCRCLVKKATDGGPRCEGNVRPINNVHVYLPHYHEDRQLTGDNLPAVEANKVKCYRWKTRACRDGPNICELHNKTKDSMDIISSHGQAATLRSPQFNEDKVNHRFGRSYFCLYNVSLNCPRQSVVVASTDRTTWPGENTNCENYMAFYTNPNQTVPQPGRRFCGEHLHYSTTLDSDSFLAVMWTTNVSNRGNFEFSATCNQEEVVTPVATTEQATSATEEGSGSNIVLGVEN